METCDSLILYHYLNAHSPYHGAAKAYLEAHFANPGFALCEPVLEDLYARLRSPQLNRTPASAAKASAAIKRLRQNPHWALMDYPGGLMNELWAMAARVDCTPQKLKEFKWVLTFKHHRIAALATAQPENYAGLGIKRVFNPLNGPTTA